MMVYIFQAALLCACCGEKIITAINLDPFFPTIKAQNSDHYPQGPYGQGGGEADCPQHCDHCGVFLENPLTPDGVAYMADAVRSYLQDGKGNGEVIEEWRTFYRAELDQYLESLWDENKQH